MSRELDAVIAKALGGKEYILRTLPCYSTDGNAMFELDRQMRERDWWVSVRLLVTGQYEATYTKWAAPTILTYEKAVADTEPLARVLAAYKALTGKEWEGEGE